MRRLTAALVAITALASVHAAQHPSSGLPANGLPEHVATFSILGYDPDTGEVGGAVQSRVFSVGNGVLWGEANVGMAAASVVEIQRLVSGLTIPCTAGGGLVVEAPPETVSTLAALFSAIAQLLQVAAVALGGAPLA
ncbi:MAG: DUF1028 domain-containing protein [Acidobacteria bacterium]|nr:DUF1028 domain-containing protein [Acidobacteriota bacterium]